MIVKFDGDNPGYLLTSTYPLPSPGDLDLIPASLLREVSQETLNGVRTATFSGLCHHLKGRKIYP